MPRQPLTFELARFAWGAPDQLELSGRFLGLGDGPPDGPELVIRGADGARHLPVVPGSLSGPMENGRWWDAVFAWQEPPVAFEAAQLTFGSDLVVDLPGPNARRSRSRRRTLRVSRAAAEPTNGDAPAEPSPAPEAVQRLRAQAELLATQEALHDARETLQRTQEELARVRDDLVTEREQRAADAERFQHALGELRATAEEALDAEQGATREVRGELREALEMLDGKNTALGGLEAAEAAARSELEGLKDRIAELERDGAEADTLRGHLEAARAEADTAAEQRDRAHTALEEAREDAQRLLERLSSAHDAVGDAA
jgi:hypothetical protein